MRTGRADFVGLAPHEIRVLQTALLVDDTIDFTIGRLAAPAAGATALH